MSMMMQIRRTSSQNRPTIIPSLTKLPSTPLDPSITAYNHHRIRSRSEKGSSIRNTFIPQRSKILASSLGDVFEAADKMFRNSLAFRYPSDLALPPRRKETQMLWRSNVMDDDYQQAKIDEIRKSHYVSNYRLAQRGEWYKGRHL